MCGRGQTDGRALTLVVVRLVNKDEVWSRPAERGEGEREEGCPTLTPFSSASHLPPPLPQVQLHLVSSLVCRKVDVVVSVLTIVARLSRLHY